MGKEASSDGRTLNRLSIPLTETGLLDWDRVRGSTAQKLLELLRDDNKLAAEFDELRGIKGQDDPQMDLFGGITEENVHSILDGISKANAAVFQFVAAKWIKHPLPFMQDGAGKRLPLVIEPDILQKMEFSEKQHKELDPRGVRIAKRYERNMPHWLKEHFDIYMFATMFLAYSAENAKTVLNAQLTRDLKRVQDSFARAQAAKARPVDTDVPIQKSSPTNGEDKNPPLEFLPSQPEVATSPDSEAPRA